MTLKEKRQLEFQVHHLRWKRGKNGTEYLLSEAEADSILSRLGKIGATERSLPLAEVVKSLTPAYRAKVKESLPSWGFDMSKPEGVEIAEGALGIILADAIVNK